MNESTTKNPGSDPAINLFPCVNMFPALSVDDRAALRTAAYPVLAASRASAVAAQQLGGLKREGFWQSAVVTASSALSACAAGLTLLGASIALALATDDAPTPAQPATTEVA